jgi:hypothetical protein
MALDNKKQHPAFEDEGKGGAAVETAEHPKANPEAAKNEAAGAIAKAASTAVALPGKFGDVFKKYENVIEDLEFGTVARIVGTNGSIQAKKDSKKLNLGTEIQVTLVSFNDTYQISPGADTEEAKKFVKYSRDGVTIDGTGQDVKAYLEQLREVEGYPNAAVKQYTSLVCILNAVVDEDTKTVKLDRSLIGDMVEVSLSPTAGKAFKGARMQRSVKVSRGLAKDDGSEAQLVVRAEVRNNGSKDYTALAVSEK